MSEKNDRKMSIRERLSLKNKQNFHYRKRAKLPVFFSKKCYLITWLDFDVLQGDQRLDQFYQDITLSKVMLL